jgi:hypothetical protein
LKIFNDIDELELGFEVVKILGSDSIPQIADLKILAFKRGNDKSKDFVNKVLAIHESG